MNNRSMKKATRKAYETPKLTVYGKVSELTQDGRGRKRRGNGGGGGGRRRGQGRGRGGSRS